ncbi:MAG: hypothetical protein RR515_03015, partial [Clostridium sp.]
MKKLNLNYYTVFLTFFRIVILVETISFLYSGKTWPAIYGLLTFITTFLISILYKLTKLNPSLILRFTVQFFIFLSMFLGNMNKIYSYIPNGDDILHISAGFISALFAYSTLEKLDNGQNILINNKTFVAFYIVIFGIASGGIWEMFEFTTDSLFSLTSQGGSLTDTMFDIINGTIGPVIMSSIYLKNPS